LLARLLFCPRLLLATAKSRHTAAAGRRQVVSSLTKARAAHFGTVRVAEACGRRAAMAELRASICAAKQQRASLLAAEAIDRVAARARHFNARCVAAKMRLSHVRLCELDRAICAEERRQRASMRRTQRLLNLKANRYGVAAQMAARARRAQISATRATAYAHAAMRSQAASAALALHLKSVVEAARAMSRGKRSDDTPQAMPSPSSAGLPVVPRLEGSDALRLLAVKLSRAHATDGAMTKSLSRSPSKSASGKVAVKDPMVVQEEMVLAAEARKVAAIEGAITAVMRAMHANAKLESAIVSEEKADAALKSLADRLRKHANGAALLSQLSQVDAETTGTGIVPETNANVEKLVVVGTAMSIHEEAQSEAATEDWEVV